MTFVELPVVQEPITVVVVTDSFLIGDGLAALLDAVTEVEVVGRARNLNELTSLVDDLMPQAVIISVRHRW